ncbi:MAG TPA: adenylate/guanylate cyclase domain-containing protein [Roseiarcus sp.]|jgi:TolB-like protein|nr:adenylate/guanylate cyclase domain-containing protein [Roseiarcus sp.]
MSETRKIAAILVSDVVGYSRLAGADEDRTLARLRGLRSDLIDPAIAAHRGRIVKGTGDGLLAEFRSVVDAARCAIEVQNGMVERNTGLPPDRRIDLRIGIHVGDVVEEQDGDLMGESVNIAARFESICKPGAICLSEDAYRQVRARLNLAVNDLWPTQLKNIAEPIRVYALDVGEPAQAKAAPAPALEKPTAPRLSIVVLPFANIGADPEQEYFVDGVTESLTTDLSRIGGSFVIGRNTAFTYKGKAVDLKQIGRELNVRYVLEGSVQRGGNRMRVNVQLIDVESGSHLWAERFERPVADLFALQDEIVARLANALQVQLVAAEARREERVSTPDSMDLYFQGMSWIYKGASADTVAKAGALFQKALNLDPANVDALTGLAIVNFNVAAWGGTDHSGSYFATSEAAASRALSLAPDNALTHVILGLVLGFTKRAEQAMAHCERALALDRNLAAAHGMMGLYLVLLGRAEESEAAVEEALRLSPRDPWAFAWIWSVGLAISFLDRPEEAVVWLRRSLDSNRNYPPTHFYLAAAFAQLGRPFNAGLALDPRFTLERFRLSAESDNPIYLARRERLIDHLRQAGVPEA